MGFSFKKLAQGKFLPGIFRKKVNSSNLKTRTDSALGIFNDIVMELQKTVDTADQQSSVQAQIIKNAADEKAELDKLKSANETRIKQIKGLLGEEEGMA